MTNPPGAFWPSERQQLLLRAALGDEPTATEAWHEVRPRISLDELEPGSFELLPLIYSNLSNAGHDDVDLQRLKGIYRRTWVKNNLLLERTKAASEEFDASGIRAEFIEGVVIASRFYSELGQRPTSMIDMLVDPVDAPAALAALARTGWKTPPEPIPHVSAHYLTDETTTSTCALRTRLADDLTTPTADVGARSWLWETGERHHSQQLEIPVPPTTETLFAVCVMHARAAGVPNVQWIVDVKMAMQQADVDWQRIIDLAEETGQVPRLRDALAYSARLPGSTPPPEVCDRLAAIPVSRRLRISHAYTTGAARGPARVSVLVGEHLAATVDRSPLGVIAAFPSFLRDRWGVARTWQVPFAAGKRAIRLLRERQAAA